MVIDEARDRRRDHRAPRRTTVQDESWWVMEEEVMEEEVMEEEMKKEEMKKEEMKKEMKEVAEEEGKG
jgi:hypothetical protein